MIIVDDKKDVRVAQLATRGASSSSTQVPAPPPPFTQPSAYSNLDAIVYAPPGGEDPPPEFVPYEAEYFRTDDGNVVSHDPHLNEDGEALYRFLLSQAQTPPQLFLRVHGEHQEHRTHSVPRTDAQGRTHWRTETETVTVVDFNFTIDISHHIPAAPIHWSVPDEQPAYRGEMYQEVDAVTLRPTPHANDLENGVGGRKRLKATRKERKAARAWQHERRARGLPPWIGPDAGWVPRAQVAMNSSHMNVYKSSKTVREWADEYCGSPKILKEFTYTKVIHGWNFDALEAAVVAAVKSTYYQGSLTVKFEAHGDEVHVRADHWLARALSNKWTKFLLIITLVYPIIWLFKRFARSGGGRWEVCGAAYALVSWQPVQPEDDITGPPPPFSEEEPAWAAQAPTGTRRMKLVGTREGEWFQKWETTIKRAVTGRCQSDVPLAEPDAPIPAALMLDGYRP